MRFIFSIKPKHELKFTHADTESDNCLSESLFIYTYLAALALSKVSARKDQTFLASQTILAAERQFVCACLKRVTAAMQTKFLHRGIFVDYFQESIELKARLVIVYVEGGRKE